MVDIPPSFTNNDNPYSFTTTITSDPYNNIKNKLDTLNTLQPPLIPIGIDSTILINEHTNIINKVKINLINKLIDQEIERLNIKIEQCTINNSILTTQYNNKLQSLCRYLHSINFSDKLLLSSLLKIKKLMLHNKQQMLRKSVYKNVNSVLTPVQLLSATQKCNRNVLNDLYILDSLESKYKSEQLKRETYKKIEICRNIIDAYKKIMSTYKIRKHATERFYKHVSNLTHSMYKQENRKHEKVLRERIKALKNNDERAYLKLLDEKKDGKIQFILRKTDEYLNMLKDKIREQQGDNKYVFKGGCFSYKEQYQGYELGGVIDSSSTISKLEGVSNTGSVLEGISNSSSSLSSTNRGVIDTTNTLEGVSNNTVNNTFDDYFDTAHLLNERILEQPSCLKGGLLKEYQMRGIEWLLSLYNNNLNGILADEMGLGKTIQTIGFISYLTYVKHISGMFIIICPLSVMSNWRREFEKWCPEIRVMEYKGSPDTRKVLQKDIKNLLGVNNKNYDNSIINTVVVLTTYEFVMKDKNFLSKINWFYLIVDEGHRLKNKESRLCSVISSKYASKYRLLITGTPLQNNLSELWGLLNFILPRIFNSSKNFEEWFNMSIGERIECTLEEQMLLIQRLHKVLRPFLLRRLKRDVEVLPEKIERVILCKMSNLQKYLYERLIRRASELPNTDEDIYKANVHKNCILEKMENFQISDLKGISNTLMQLRKICNHPFCYEEVEYGINPTKMNNYLLYTTCGKFEILNKMLPKLKTTGHRVLMFFQMTQVMTIMEDFLHMNGYKYLRLDGNVKSEERNALINIFNNGDYFVFLLSTRAGGLGLNLQVADTVIIYDSDWNPFIDLQAQDRAHRIGQKNEVRIYRLITNNSIEETIMNRAVNKLNLDNKVIQAGMFDQRSTQEERENLLKEAFSKVNENVINDDELNEILARDEDEMVIFREMDKEYKGHKLEECDCEEKSENIEFFEEKKKFLENIKSVVDNNNRYRIDIFMNLPDKKLYPDYYLLIEKPISMNCIYKKIGKYKSMDEMKEDLGLMFRNALKYNLEGSVVYEDAICLMKYVEEY